MLMLDSEKELEDFLYENGSRILNPSGYSYDTCLRQVSIPGYGTMDLVFIEVTENALMIRIAELKKEKLDLNSVAQIARYRQGLIHYASQFKLPADFSIDVCGVLVGREFSGEDTRFLIDSIPWLDCYFFELTLDEGITFKRQTLCGHSVLYWHRSEINKTALAPLYKEIKSYYLQSLRCAKDYDEYHATHKVAANA